MPNLPRQVLYANEEQSIFILDIPACIEEAQLQHHTHPQTLSSHDSQAQAQSRILASSPLREPWPSTEPKSAQARSNILSHQTSDDKTGTDVEELAKAVECALHAVKNILGSASLATRKEEEGKATDRSAWCLPRLVATEVEGPDGQERGNDAVKRRRIDHPTCLYLAIEKRRAYTEPLHVVRSLNGGRDHGIVVTLDVDEKEDREGLLAANPTLTRTQECPTRMQLNEGWDCSFVNTTRKPLRLTATTPSSTSERNARERATFTIPPHTTFLQSDIFRPGALHLIAAAHLSQSSHRLQTPRPTSHATSATSSNFDIILLDPPWPNHSVRRTKHAHSHSNSTSAHLYASNPPRSLDDLTTNLRTLPLNDLLSNNGLIGVWITNRPAVRNAVLDGGDSLFEAWDLEVVEEWIWVKTTAYGEPVTPLRGVWRHPWEILLLGRKRTTECEGVGEGVRSVRRRFIFAVPDAHSRKPNLRSLFTLLWSNLALIPDAREKEAEQSAKLIGLELFARSLTAGWCCIGDEVLRFQEASWWSTPPHS